ncbi:MAG: lipoprotein insertase outer membrane protein LolB [Francisellaceae bacterium]
MRYIKTLGYFAVLTCSTLLISACSTLPSTQIPASANPNLSWQDYQTALQSLQHWEASGIVGVRMNNHGDSANFIWRQNKDEFYLQIYGPLGIGSTIFSGRANDVTMTDSDGIKTHATSLRALMDKKLGWHLPIDGLYYWVRGLPEPGMPYKQSLNSQGLSAMIIQNQWQTQFENYALFENQYPLAQKIRMQYGDLLQLTAIIKLWKINQ